MMKQKREKSPATLQNVFCYTSDELMEYISGSPGKEKRNRIAFHLNSEKCPRCRRIFQLLENKGRECVTHNPEEYTPDPARLEKLKSEKEKHSPEPVPFNSKTSIESGQIWTTTAKPKSMNGEELFELDAGGPVLILDAGNKEKKLNNVIRVIPLSFDTEFHMPGETLLLEHEGPMHISFLIEVFNESPMLAGNVSQYKGIFSRDDMEKIKEAVYNFYTAEDEKPEKDPDIEDEDPDYITWKKKELKLAGYLAAPVNESIWCESHEVLMTPYQKAAASGTDPLPDIKAVLLDNEEAKIVILQKSNQAIIRCEPKSAQLEGIKIGGRWVDFADIGFNAYDAVIGIRDEQRKTVSIVVELDCESYTFDLTFDFEK